MIYLVLFLSLFAHEDLPSTTCELGKEKIVITRDGETYELQLPGQKQVIKMKKPQTKDWYDPKRKQLFDTYTFKKSDLSLVVKRPETVGPEKVAFAEWNQKTFKCPKLKGESPHSDPH